MAIVWVVRHMRNQRLIAGLLSIGKRACHLANEVISPLCQYVGITEEGSTELGKNVRARKRTEEACFSASQQRVPEIEWEQYRRI